MNTDVTDRRLAEDELRQTDQRKDQFLATLGHELRNPLAPLRTVAHLLKDTLPDDPQLQRLRDMLERQVSQLTRLVDDLLDVSRIKSGRIRLQLQRLDFRDVVRDAAVNMEPMAAAHEQRLDVEQPDVPLTVDGDSVRLAQIVTNLLDNAVKYTPAGGRIKVATRRVSGQVELSVADNGSGIPPELLSQIFDVFCQGANGPGSSGGGLGLGLTLVRKLAQLHGGSADVRSEGPDRGSEFIVRFPIAAQPAAVEPPAGMSSAGAADARSVATPARAPRRILVVDDNEDAAETLALMLEREGHEVRRARDGRAALEMASEFAPEVVLLDIGLPDMTGYDLSQALRQQATTASATLIAVTGYGQDRDRGRSTSAGIDRHLVKPVDTAKLLRVIGSL